RLNISLMGDIYEDILASDPEGIILSWKENADGIEVDGLGVDQIIISYTTPSITNKTGSKWTVMVESDANPIITLPKDAVLVGLNPTPLAITTLDVNTVITMPAGTSSVSYLLGTTGTRENALILLTQAQGQVSEAGLSAVVIQAEELLEDAQEAYHGGQYSQSEQLSRQAMEQASTTLEMADQALDSINRAFEMIGSKFGLDVDEAQSVLDSAEVAHLAGDYQKAMDDADQAYALALALEAEPEPDGFPITYIIGGAVVLVAAGAFLMMGRKKPVAKIERPESEQPDVDLDEEFKKRPHLRTDDKAILRFIQDSGGAFITEIRERFDIPKSSAWRMIKRLEDEGLIQSTTVGRETYLQLGEPGEEQ
ncbi:winged helix-turn-helix transcriptional regulator, partial [Candidatus Bathyarchaeota archaeon]|nr:winged helix-turn-helix transcriptional regulator [Candidatus Bathyarchaeota archaeon]